MKNPKAKTANDLQTETCAKDPYCPIVAIGASAGGLEVFGQFFEKTPTDTGLAFVLVQHLDPTHPTLMPELLSKHTSMPVLRAEDGLKVQPNTVYVIAPNGSLLMEGCALRVGPLAPGGDGKVIDLFFRSIALDQRENVIGIVLSGTGTDGTQGLKAIKEQGGLTIAQKPDSAKFDGMPRNAVSSGFVDFVLTVDEMPERLLAYIKHVKEVRHRKGVDALQSEVIKFLPKIVSILRERTGHDFSRYKQSTLARRIQRRMQLMYLDSAENYADCMAQSADEMDALFKDLLIGVTQFFRDPDSFDLLAKKIIPRIFRDKGSDAQVRVWVPGCASGEEAYTFAILLAEHAEQLAVKPKIQVFATDLDVEALEFARKAKYPVDIAHQISPDRLKRYFKKSGNSYELAEPIRELCVFSPHNLIKDPPFSRLDLISCRNVLIYLEADLQKKLLPVFHYALNPSGILFLGPSENVASRSELFRTMDQKHRVFQRKPMVLHGAAATPMIDPGQVTKLQTWAASATANPLREPNVARSIERLIVEEYSPASVVINEHGEVVFFAGDTGRFLKSPAGSPNNKLVAMARENLRLELRTLIHRAISSRKEAIRENLRLKSGRDNLHIDLIVRPLTELGPETGLYIVLFRELKLAEHAGFAPTEDFASQEHPIIKQLEGELRTTRDDLQTTIEELETSNEELKSANEELLSMNEELQSANEEMQTSKEEVQSANDELQRKVQESDEVNAELRRAQQERAEYAAIVQNSNDAIIGKTLGGIITSWNPAAERVFGYSADEMIGQSILRIIPPELYEEEERILQTLRRGDPVELYKTERLTKSGRVILVSLTSSPIRDAQGFIIGASKIARDITAQMAGVRASMLLAAVVDSSEDAIISKTLDGIVTSWNPAAEKMFGYAASEMIGRSITRLFPEDRLQEEANVIARISRGERIEHFETIRKAKDGRQIEISLTISPIRDGTGKIIGASKIARNITAQKAATRSHLLLSAIVDSSDDAIISKTLDGIVTSWNYGAQRTFGYSAEEMIGQPITKLFPPDRLDEELYVLSRIRNGQRIEHFETVRRAKDGTLLDISLTISPIKDAQGQIIGASKIARDVTVQKAATRASQLLASIVDSSDDAIISKRLDGIVTSWNKAAEKMFGYTDEEMIGNPVTRLFPPDRLEEEPKIVGRIANGERVEHFETIRKTKDGRRLDVSLTISPIRDFQGRIIGASKIARDISDALKTKRDLQEETGILELLNATGSAIASELNLESLVQQVTDAGTKLSGAKFGAFFYNVINEQGESFLLHTLSGAPREAFEKFGLPRNTPIFNPTFRGQGLVRSDDITKDPRYGTMAPHHGMPQGHLPVCSYLAASVTSRSGEIIGGLFFGHPDPGVFTERAERLILGLAGQAAVAIDNARLFDNARRSEASLQKAKDELEEKVSERTASLRETTEQLETFCYSVAHDLRSPLRAQQSFAQALIDEHKDSLGESGLEYATRILHSAERLDKLVHDLLTYSRMSRAELKFEDVSLNKVLQDIQDTHAHEIQKLGAIIRVGDLHSVFAYEPTLNLIVTNLFLNGMKFVTPGATPCLKVWTEQRGQRVRLWVEDRGIGIDPEGVNKIFGVFQRLHPINKYPGTGIGLAIVQKGVERMGGNVGVESELGKGSRFWIELPGAHASVRP